MSNDYSKIRTNGPIPDPSTVDTSEMIEDLWQAYVDSASSLLSELEVAAMDYENGNDLEENAAAIRRILHSIKGESGIIGLMDVYSLCHEAEYGFEELDYQTRSDMILKVKDWISSVIDGIIKGHTPNDTRPVEKFKTLIVDDDRICRKSVEMLIGEYCDCSFANNGQMALSMFVKAYENKSPYKLVTLDVQMPKMDGHETLTAIRQFERDNGIEGLDGVKIIMTTAQEESEHIFSAFRKGCEAYVIKKKVRTQLIPEMIKLGLLESESGSAVT